MTTKTDNISFGPGTIHFKSPEGEELFNTSVTRTAMLEEENGEPVKIIHVDLANAAEISGTIQMTKRQRWKLAKIAGVPFWRRVRHILLR